MQLGASVLTNPRVCRWGPGHFASNQLGPRSPRVIEDEQLTGRFRNFVRLWGKLERRVISLLSMPATFYKDALPTRMYIFMAGATFMGALTLEVG